MKFYPKAKTENGEKPEKDMTVIRQIALIFAFVSVYGFAIKLIFF